MAKETQNAESKEPESNAAPTPDPLVEGLREIRRARAKWNIFWIYTVPVIAVVYGAVAFKPYYLLLGLAALVLLWFF